tara:strand:+ start:9357 stop:10625 length:1269 start_codon:yes stop_codon:yes gene_type:complete
MIISSIRSRAVVLLATTLFSVFVQSGRAQEGLRSLPDSAAVSGKMGAKFATVDDPTATRFNPANLSFLDGTQVLVGASVWYGEVDFQSLVGTSEEMGDPLKYTGGLYLGGPIGDSPFSWGFSASAPYGVDMRWKRDGVFEFALPHEASLVTLDLSPAISYQISEKTTVGAALNVMWSQLNLEQDFPWVALTGVPGTPNGVQEFDGDGWGVGATFGITHEIAEGHRIAATGRLSIPTDLSGDYTITNIPAPLEPFFSDRSDYNTEMEFPWSYGVGYAVDLCEAVTLGFDFEYIGNSTHDDLPVDIGVNQALAPSDSVGLNWEDSFSVGTGLDYRVNEKLTLRLGYLYTQTPIPDETYIPLIPGADRNIVTFGLGYQTKRGSWDFAYVAGFYQDREIRTNVVPQFNGNYESQWDVFTISHTINF